MANNTVLLTPRPKTGPQTVLTKAKTAQKRQTCSCRSSSSWP